MYRINGRLVVKVDPSFPHAFKTKRHKNMAYAYIANASIKLGRPLTTTECVHHVDGDPDNNDPTNLMVFASRADHTKFHGLGSDMSMLIELENGVFCIDKNKTTKLARCSHCGKDFIFNKGNHKNAVHNVYCSATCSKAAASAASKLPAKEVLESLISSNSMSAIGRMYGVSANTVKKWLIKYNLR